MPPATMIALQSGTFEDYLSRELLEDKDSIAFLYQSLPSAERTCFMILFGYHIDRAHNNTISSTNLAAEGVSAPVIKIEVEEDRDNFNITFTQLSGEQGTVIIEKPCTVGDTAAAILPKLNRQKQEKGEEPVEYIHLVLGDKKFVPWDHDKPLAEFLT